MSLSLRCMLILGCLMLVALEAPRTSLVLAEDLAGPYVEPALESAALDAVPQRSAATIPFEEPRTR